MKFYLNKKKKSNDYFALIILLNLFGFYLGNIFSTCLPIFMNFFLWNGLATVFVILFIEFLSYLYYKYNIPLTFNYFKIGFLLGLFIDAFKVGS